MKHYFMAFFILFSALSSSWVGAVVFSDPQGKSVLSEQQIVVSEQKGLVHGCSSMQSTASNFQQMDTEYCVNCFDQCQCDNSTCHKVNSPLVGIHLDLINIQDIAKLSPLFVSSRLQNSPIFLDFRPPKNS